MSETKTATSANVQIGTTVSGAHDHECVSIGNARVCIERGHCLCSCGAKQQNLTDTWTLPATEAKP